MFNCIIFEIPPLFKGNEDPEACQAKNIENLLGASSGVSTRGAMNVVTGLLRLWYYGRMPYFVVQEHHSRNLHYDFRLEAKGILKSWAIPKGISMAPKDKRLAIQVDDHPMEYGQYEGIIPEGYYGAGPVLIWDSGTYDPLHIDLSGGKLEFVLHGNELRGAFVMMRLKDKDRQWLLIKKRDRYALDSYQTKPLMTREDIQRLRETIPPCNIEE